MDVSRFRQDLFVDENMATLQDFIGTIHTLSGVDFVVFGSDKFGTRVICERTRDEEEMAKMLFGQSERLASLLERVERKLDDVKHLTIEVKGRDLDDDFISYDVKIPEERLMKDIIRNGLFEMTDIDTEVDLINFLR